MSITDKWLTANGHKKTDHTAGYISDVAENSRARIHNVSLDILNNVKITENLDIDELIKSVLSELSPEEQQLWNDYQNNLPTDDRILEIKQKIYELVIKLPEFIFAQETERSGDIVIRVNLPKLDKELEKIREILEEKYSCKTEIIQADLRDNAVRVRIRTSLGEYFKLWQKQILLLVNSGKCQLNKSQHKRYTELFTVYYCNSWCISGI